MKKRKLIVIGDVGAGKTTLLAALRNDDNVKVKKTQTVIYDAYAIDTPGEYMENPSMYKYIIAEAQGVKYVIFLQDSTRKKCIYPHGFAQSFNGMTIGVISKIDDPASDVCGSREILETLGLKGPIFELSSKNRTGINELLEFIKD